MKDLGERVEGSVERVRRSKRWSRTEFFISFMLGWNGSCIENDPQPPPARPFPL